MVHPHRLALGLLDQRLSICTGIALQLQGRARFLMLIFTTIINSNHNNDYVHLKVEIAMCKFALFVYFSNTKAPTNNKICMCHTGMTRANNHCNHTVL